MIKLTHDGEILSYEASGTFDEIFSEFGEVCVAFIERFSKDYNVAKSLITEAFIQGIQNFQDSENLYATDLEA